MWQLWVGVVLFGGMHLFSILFPARRNAVKAAMGVGVYMGLYTLISLVGVVFLALGYLSGRAGPNALSMVYEPWYGGRHVMMLLVLVGFILIFANGSKAHIRRWVGHPFSVGVILWSTGHLLVNGETAVVVIFAMFLVLSVFDVVLSVARGKWPTHEGNAMHDARAIAVGVVLFLIFAFGFHPYVLNIPVIG